MFDQKIFQQLQYYVYMLLDENDRPIYVGKGIDNRVFAHAAESAKTDISSIKLDAIRAIVATSGALKHVIIRHGLDEKTAYAVESAVIDTLRFIKESLTNAVLGYHSLELGLMSADDIIRKYSAERLEKVGDGVVIININKKYRERKDETLYEIARKSWSISESKVHSFKVALIEYKGLIVEVFDISDWYSVPSTSKKGTAKKRWEFNGQVASSEIRDQYYNKSVAHAKKRGAANPIRYQI